MCLLKFSDNSRCFKKLEIETALLLFLRCLSHDLICTFVLKEGTKIFIQQFLKA